MDSFNTIPGNLLVFNELVSTISGKRAIAFVGAGASAGLYPLWQELIKNLANCAFAEGVATSHDVAKWSDSSAFPAPAAASEIKRALGSGTFRAQIQKIFAPPLREPRFTQIHEELLRLACLGYVTTNYDISLMETRRRLYPDLPADSGSTWSDPDKLNRWVTRDIFEEVQFPILFAHGIYDRGDTIILGDDDYRAAYAPGLYRVAIERLWSGERLLFVGFGFNDPWLEFVASDILERVQAFRTDKPRHTALLALRDGDDAPALRFKFREKFNARVLFYPVLRVGDGHEDHGNLLRLLKALSEGVAASNTEAVGRRRLPVWVVPHTPTRTFIGQIAFLDKLDNELSHHLVVCITGMPGIGKTELALQLVYRWRATKRVSAILWCRAETDEQLTADLASVAMSLGVEEAGIDNGPVRIAALSERWLTEQEDWLLVLDNVERLETVERLLPRTGNRHTLITTRSVAVAVAMPTIQLMPLSSDDGVSLLLARTNGSRPTISATDLEDYSSISKEVGGLPLALVIAGRSIAESQATPARYLQKLEQAGVAALDLAGQPGAQSGTGAILLAFRRLAETNVNGADLLRFCAFLAPDAIPEELVDAGLASNDIGDGIDARVAAASRHGFVRRDATAQTLTIHRVIQAVVRIQLGNPLCAEWASRATAAVALLFPDPKDFSHWAQCERLLAHAQSCFYWIDNLKLATVPAANLLNYLGYYLDERGQYEKVEPIYRRALEIREALLGPEHPDFATSLSNLAWHYRARGRYDLAEPMYERALQIRRKVFGDNALDTASSMNTLAMLYQDRGRFQEAEELLKSALQTRIRLSGSENLKTAAIQNNLGWLLSECKRHEEARELLERALRVRTATWPAGHPDTAATLNILGFLWRNHGDLDRAATYTSDGLAMRMKVLGPDHPETATSMNSLGEILTDLKRMAEAEGLFNSAKRTLERAHCERSPEMAWSLQGLARIAFSRMSFLEADRLYINALNIAQTSMGELRYDVVNLRKEHEVFRRTVGL